MCHGLLRSGPSDRQYQIRVKIVCDIHIPFLAEAVQSAWPEVQIFPMKPEQIGHSAVWDADVLVVRTRTKVDQALLAGSKVQLVCTATIGYDHLDTAWCDAQGIRWMSCPGCNAQAVCDYVEEALREFPISYPKGTIISNMPTIGIVGVGHVGSRVAEMAARKGYHVLLNDPPKGIGVSLDEIAEKCDIVTFHVPLMEIHNSQFTIHNYHLCDEAFLAKCKPDALIINASRGGVVDEKALLRAGNPYVLDTWEGEPQIDPEVLAHAFLASMHIAGYSMEGKRNATQMCLDAIARQFGLPEITLSAHHPCRLPVGDSAAGWLARVSASLKSHPADFESLRKAYPLR